MRQNDFVTVVQKAGRRAEAGAVAVTLVLLLFPMKQGKALLRISLSLLRISEGAPGAVSASAWPALACGDLSSPGEQMTHDSSGTVIPRSRKDC